MNSKVLASWACQCTDIGVADFSTYDMILDTRTRKEYDQDHIPGAIHVETLTPTEVDIIVSQSHRAGEATNDLSMKLAHQNIGRFLNTLRDSRFGSRFLVYCNTGEGRSIAWARALRDRGFKVTNIVGGYVTYRDWVRSNLIHLPSAFSFHVISGIHACENPEIINHIKAVGEQTLDLCALADTYGRMTALGSSKLFESHLIDRLRHMDPTRPVWVDYQCNLRHSEIIPPALLRQVEQPSRLFMVSAPREEFVRLWERRNHHLLQLQPQAIADFLLSKYKDIDPHLVSELKELATQNKTDVLVTRLILEYFDAHYDSSIERIHDVLTSVTNVSIAEINEASLRSLARDLVDVTEPT